MKTLYLDGKSSQKKKKINPSQGVACNLIVGSPNQKNDEVIT
jgi:hypothetical protein